MKQYIVKEYHDRTEYRNMDGELHREDGPAIEYADGTKSWWLNDNRHREDGPAIEFSDGSKEWWMNGIELTEEQFNRRLANDTCDGKIVIIDGKEYKLEAI